MDNRYNRLLTTNRLETRSLPVCLEGPVAALLTYLYKSHGGRQIRWR